MGTLTAKAIRVGLATVLGLVMILLIWGAFKYVDEATYKTEQEAQNAVSTYMNISAFLAGGLVTAGLVLLLFGVAAREFNDVAVAGAIVLLLGFVAVIEVILLGAPTPIVSP